MRILIVNNYAHVTGGADLHCLGITRGLRERGHEIQWLSTRSDRNRETEGSFIPLPVATTTRDEIPLLKRLDVARRAMWNPDAARAMSGLVETFRPDAVHVHKSYVQLSVAPVVVAGRESLPIVQTVHDYEFLSASPLDADGGRWDRDETRLSYRALNSATLWTRRFVHKPRVTRWIAVSNSVSRAYESVGGIESTVLPNFTKSSSEPPAPHATRKGVLYLGRLSQEKGISHILDAAKHLPEVQFTIAGDGPMKADVTEAADTLMNLEYAGFVDRETASRLVRSSRACLMPSLWQEPGPLACLEAMAEGTPVISYPNGGLAEYVEEAEAGIVCESPDSEALLGAIEELMSSETAWQEYSANGLRAVEGRHSLSTYLDSLEAVYLSAIDSRR